MRLRLVPSETKIDFFRYARVTFGFSILLVVFSLILEAVIGLNFGIDFRGGTTIRTQAETTIDVGDYRAAISPLGLGDVTITEVRDPTFGPTENVALLVIQAQEGDEAVATATIDEVEAALVALEPTLVFTSVESVGPTVSGELIWSAILAIALAIGAVLIYIWLRFEWQFSLGAVAALAHDVIVTVGVFSLLQIQFDLSIIAALLTIVGYSLNDTVVVFDRVRENLRRFKKKALRDVLNLSINETLSRTLMTSVTTLLALLSLYILGGDVIRGFVFAMIWGVIIGTYSSIFVASNVLLFLGVKRDWSKPGEGPSGTQFANIDA
ncbi:MAG: protein translocase subunit SecF [Pseudomonadota bacterium]